MTSIHLEIDLDEYEDVLEANGWHAPASSACLAWGHEVEAVWYDLHAAVIRHHHAHHVDGLAVCPFDVCRAAVAVARLDLEVAS